MLKRWGLYIPRRARSSWCMIKKWKTTLKFRMSIGFFFIGFFGFLLFIRAFNLQVIESGRLKKDALRQFYEEIYYTPKRGNIYSSNGSILATSINIPGVAVDPLMVKNKLKTAEELSKITGISFERIINILNLRRQFAWIKKRVSTRVENSVEKLGIRGLVIVNQPVRYFPDGSLLSQVLGFVGIDDNGLSGLEFKYNKYLAGNKKGLKILHDGLGQYILLKGFGLRKATEGDDIYLTINKKLQFITQYYLDKEAQAADSESAFAIIMDPNTGAILAMADYPEFDPNKYWEYPAKLWRNRAVTDDFEPGSTMKPFVVAGALSEGLVKPDAVFNCYNGKYPIKGIVVHDVAPGFGNLQVSQIVEYSSNIGACQIGMKFNRANLYNWFRNWGFGQSPGGGLLGEATGIVKPLNRWSEIGPCEMAFGQGISVTGLQEIVALSAIANGGYMVRPYIIRKIVDPYGRVVFRTKVKYLRTVISPLVDAEVKHMMRLVVKGGTGQYANLIDFRVSGKTGTSQIVNPKTGRYYSDLYNASFMGFFPYAHPRLVMLVVQEKPRKISYYGGAVSAPVVKEVFESAINILNIYPGQNAYNKEIVAAGAGAGTAGQNNAKTQSGADTASGGMPDLTGETIYQALDSLKGLNLKVSIKGSGFLYYQSIKPGTSLDNYSGKVIYLKFRSKRLSMWINGGNFYKEAA